MRISAISHHIGGQLHLNGHEDRDITAIQNLGEAGINDLAFFDGKMEGGNLCQARPGLLIAPALLSAVGCPQIIHPNPKFAFAKAAQMIVSRPPSFEGISDRASVDPSANIGRNVRIGAFAFIGAHVTVEDDAVIHPHAAIHDHVHIGKGCIIHSHVTIYHECRLGREVIIHAGSVIGGDGFGYASDGDQIIKIPQVGRVIIEDHVEIGTLSNIDRGALKDTVIGKSSKIDSLVHLAHNVTIGQNCFICGQSGVAGSARLGNGVTLAGQSGVADHVVVGDRVVIGARGVVHANIETAGVYHGFPAVPTKEFWRQRAAIQHLPTMHKELKALRRKLEELEKKHQTPPNP